jgi:ATP-dependent Clp protease ATP-binding subunit ClpB
VIQQRLQNELANAILGGDFAEGQTITVDVQNGDFTFAAEEQKPVTAAR